MNKKDRVALVLSILYLFFVVLLLAIYEEVDIVGISLLSIPVLIYWGYRFIKGDISFIGGGYK